MILGKSYRKALRNDTVVMAIGIVGIFTSYLIFGVFQEAVFRTEYSDGARFRYPFVAIGLQSLAAYLVTLLLLRAFPKPTTNVPRKDYFKIAALRALSTVCSNWAILYLAYPTQVLAKCCKLLSVLIIGSIYLRRRYSLRRYLCCILLTAGLATFLLQGRSRGAEDGSSFVGIVLVLLSLFGDGLYSALQDKLREKYHVHQFEFMMNINKWGFFVNLICSIFSLQLPKAISFCVAHPVHVPKLALFAITSVLGENFIFLILTKFGSLVLAIVTTSRKFFTILLSVIMNGHAVSFVQWIAVAMVFGGVAWDSIGSSLEKQAKAKAAKWTDMQDIKLQEAKTA